jgi:hypothetical protein
MVRTAANEEDRAMAKGQLRSNKEKKKPKKAKVKPVAAVSSYAANQANASGSGKRK